MALVYTDGYELARVAISGTSSTSASRLALNQIGYLTNTSFGYSIQPSPLKEGVNGHAKLRLGSSCTITTTLNSPLSAGILSFLGLSNGTGSTLGHTWASVNGGGQEIVAIRTVSYSTVFPSSGYVMEIFAGGVQVGTFFWPVNNFNAWARWTLVWSTEGTEVTAALYREGVLVLQGTGGNQGVGVSVDSYTFQTLGSSSSITEFDSVTVWDNPVADIQKAKSAHWIASSPLSEDFPGLPVDNFTTFSGVTFPVATSTFPTLGSPLRDTDQNSGIFAVRPMTIDLPLTLPEPTGITSVYGVAIRSLAVGTESLTTASQSIVSNGVDSPKISSDVSTFRTVVAVAEADPETEEPWAVPTEHLLIDPAGDGGFELGPTFQDNGWEVVFMNGEAGWFCGSLGAITGQRGAFLSKNGTDGTDLGRVGPLLIFGYLVKEVTIPEGVHQVRLRFALAGGATNSSSIALNWGLAPGETLVPVNANFHSSLTSLSQGWQFFTRTDNKSTFFTSTSITGNAEPSATFQHLTQLSLSTVSIGQKTYTSSLKRVLPGQTYKLIFSIQYAQIGLTVTEPIRLDDISLVGYEGGIANASARFEAS